MKTQALLLILPITLALAGCSSQPVQLGQTSQLAQRDVTETKEAVVFPDDNPSVPDGQAVWKSQNCAQCHGSAGETPVQVASNSKPLRLDDKLWVARQTPLDQYMFLTYGKGNHPALKDKLSRRQIWDLLFYSRSLAIPALTDAEFDAVDPVFGSNCAVCHGKRGHGDGPLAKNMEPVPANFHQMNRFYARTDDQIWDHIANGIQWEGMPNFLGKKDSKKNVTFDKEYIRLLVKYVRAFHSSNKATQPQTASADTAAHSMGQ